MDILGYKFNKLDNVYYNKDLEVYCYNRSQAINYIYNSKIDFKKLDPDITILKRLKNIVPKKYNYYTKIQYKDMLLYVYVQLYDTINIILIPFTNNINISLLFKDQYNIFKVIKNDYLILDTPELKKETIQDIYNIYKYFKY